MPLLNSLSAISLAAALPPHPRLSETIVFQLNGLVVVTLALAAIWGAVEVIGLFFRRSAVPATVAPPATKPLEAPLVGVPPEIVAAVSASVCVVLGARYRIHAIVAQPGGLDWAHEGRREIFASHRVR